jgi:hypothetical protein
MSIEKICSRSVDTARPDVLMLIGQEMAQIAELVKQETPLGIAQVAVE